VHYRPVRPEALCNEIVRELGPGFVRVAVDGPPAAEPHSLAGSIVEHLRGRRPAAHVRADTFWRDASLRLEWGHEDVESYLQWIDTGALRREVLDPFAVDGQYLPSLRDPHSNRSTREPVRSAPPDTVLVVSGTFLLGRDLPFDRTVHLALTPAARARRTPAELAWTLPAHDEYDAGTRPADLADLVVRYNDPQHPAVRV